LPIVSSRHAKPKTITIANLNAESIAKLDRQGPKATPAHWATKLNRDIDILCQCRANTLLKYLKIIHR
jgi:hypothetical protein